MKPNKPITYDVRAHATQTARVRHELVARARGQMVSRASFPRGLARLFDMIGG